MKLRKKFLVIPFILFVLCSFAQNQTNNAKRTHPKSANSPTGCGTDHLHNYLFQTDSVYFKSYGKAQNLFRGKLNEGFVKANSYTIPLVVHVIHLGEAIGTSTNISDAQIFSAITALNDDFRKVAGSNGDGNGVDTQIEFCLASQDPYGNFTTGINRVDGSNVSDYQNQGIQLYGGNHLALKALSNWPNTDYYNIWVVSQIASTSTLGFATYPGAPNGVDGTVVLFNSFGTTGALINNLNRTLTHELGHGFNLLHTFHSTASCSSEVNCATEGDYCCDTPPHPTQPVPSCTNPDCSATEQVENYMDYTPPNCKDMFTADQKDRMLATLFGPRQSLLNSAGCTPPDTCLVPVTAALVISDVSCFGYNDGQISTNITSGTPPYNYLWNTNEGTADITNLFTGDYQLTITDAVGCTKYLSAFVTEPAAPVYNISSTDVSCYNCSDASISVSVTSGLMPFSYNWQNGSSDSVLTGLTHGSYVGTLNDADGCQTRIVVLIGQPGDTTFRKTISPPSNSSVGAHCAAIKQTANGDYVITGYMKLCDAVSQMYIARFSESGNEIWKKWYKTSIGSEGYDIDTTSDGGFIVTCYSDSTSSLLRTDGNGDIIWVKSYYNAFLLSTVTTSDNGCIASGRIQDGFGVIKLDSAGNLLWNQIFNTNNPNNYVFGDVIELSNGEYATCFHTEANGQSSSQYLARLDANGDTLWTKSYGGNSWEDSYSLVETADHGFIVSGASGSLSLNYGYESLFVNKTDSVGQLEWSKTLTNQTSIGGPSHRSGNAVETKDGGFAIAGNFYSSNWEDCIYMIKFDKNGDTVFTRNYTDQEGYETLDMLIECADGGFALVGSNYSTGEMLLIKTDINGMIGCETEYMDIVINKGTSQGNGIEVSTNIQTNTPSTLYEVTQANFPDLNTCNPECNLSINLSGADITSYGAYDGSVSVNATGQAPFTYLWSDGSTVSSMTGLSPGNYTVLVKDDLGCWENGEILLTEPAQQGIDEFQLIIHNASYNAPFNNMADILNDFCKNTADGGIIYAGTYWNSNTDIDGTFVKLDSTGTKQWAFIFDETTKNFGISVAKTNDGGYIGLYGKDIQYPYSDGFLDSWLIKVDSLGNEQWNTGLGGNFRKMPRQIIELSNGDLLAVGRIKNGLGEWQGHVAKLNATGTVLWNKVYASSAYSALNGAFELSSGKLIVVGSTEENTSTLSRDIILLALDQAGDTLWTRTYGGSSEENGVAIKETSDGSLVICANQLSDDCSTDMMLIKVDSIGNQLWANVYTQQDENISKSMSIAPNGNIMISGYSNIHKPRDSQVNLPPWTSSSFLRFSAVVIAADPQDGDLLWSRSYNTMEESYFFSIDNTADSNGLLMAGITEGNNNHSSGIYISKTNINGMDNCNSSPINFGQQALAIDTGYVSTTILPSGPSNTYTPNLVDYTLTDTVICSTYCNLYISGAITSASCSAASDGEITTTIYNTDGTVSYSWNNGMTTAQISGLTSGTYYVTATDISGCEVMDSFVVAQTLFDTLISIVAINESCSYMDDGSATVSINGGLAPYTYQWDAAAGNQTSQTATDLASGLYYVTVGDNNGCMAVDSIEIMEPLPLIISISAQDSLCGSTNSSAFVTVLLGNAIEYLWSNGTTTSYNEGLSNGNYLVTVTDINDCIAVDSVEISGAMASTLNYTICFGDSMYTEGEYQTVSGVYSDTLVAVSGCDSVLITNLTVFMIDTSIDVDSNVIQAYAAADSYQWINCSDSLPINGATGDNYEVSQTGEYAVELSQNGCVDTSECVHVILSGIAQNDCSTGLMVFPNPTTDKVIVDMGKVYKRAEIKIYDESGKLIKSTRIKNQKKVQLDMNGLAAGSYILVIESEGKRAMVNLLKQ